VLASYVPSSYKGRCRYVIALQQRFDIIEIIGVTVVKGNDYRPMGKIAGSKSLDQVLKPQRAPGAAQNLQMLSKVLRRHTEQVRVAKWQLDNTVVQQDEGSRCESVPDPPSRLLRSADATNPHRVFLIEMWRVDARVLSQINTGFINGRCNHGSWRWNYPQRLLRMVDDSARLYKE
jgi:hypothetical protein